MTKLRPIAVALAVAALVAVAHAGEPAKGKTLIPRDVLFGNPDRAAVRLSPDGKQLAYIAPLDGVMNIWVAPAADPNAAKAITHDKGRGIRSYFWAFTNQHILYLQDKDGDENWRIYSLDPRSGEAKDLTPAKGVQARIQEVSEKHPAEILIALNDRNPQLHDIYRVNIETGDKKLVMENEGYVGYLTDDDYAVRFATRVTPDGGSEVLERTPQGEWKSFMKIGQDDSLTTEPTGFDKTGQVLYVIDSRDRNTSAFATIDLKSSKETIVAEDPRADISGVLAHPTEKTIQAVAFTYHRKQWKILDPALEADFTYLRTVTDGDFDVINRTLDDKQWIVAYEMDTGPVRYYQYDHSAKKATFLFTNRKALDGLPLAKMHPVIIKSRDGLDLISYLTLPVGTAQGDTARPAQPLPMVLYVHGGPWYRDDWGYEPYHQWLANRGYAVLSVNFRGSTGLGKQFINAANLQWGGKMHDDLVDAVKWAIAEKIADPKKIAIMGGSYGGYATLVGMTFTPELFACGVDICGPSNLVTFMEAVPPYWKPILDMFVARIGNHQTEDGKKFLMERSPITRVDKIAEPLLIGQGANDPRVKQDESDQIVKAMQAKKIPVTYVLFPDEGHGFARPENRLAFNAIAELFLAQHLGGPAQPIGEDFKGSSIGVPSGAADVPGVKDALPKS